MRTEFEHTSRTTQLARTFYEFFAGGGMARAGLGPGWRCLLANDFDPKKGESYAANWGSDDLVVGDVAAIDAEILQEQADLAWASFPCQDLSLAGDYAGLSGNRSGTFWAFWKIIRDLRAQGRAPKTIMLENVYGALTSHGGKDFASICGALAGGGYRFGAMVVDARHFVPQSRPRLFILAVDANTPIDRSLTSETGQASWSPPALRAAYEQLNSNERKQWIWWNLPAPAIRNQGLSALVEADPTGVPWHAKSETDYLVSMMSPVNRTKLDEAVRITRRDGSLQVGGLYRRTRHGKQRAEVRFDDLAGCLRTPAGGSSRQTLVLVDRGNIRSRLLSPREAARLMGLSDDYVLPKSLNQALHLVGDGVAVPVVRHLAEHLIEPLVPSRTSKSVASLAAE